MERLLAVLPVFPFDLVTARLHRFSLGYRVVMRDRRSFGKIPGLRVIVL